MKFEELENKIRHVAVDIETVSKAFPIDDEVRCDRDYINVAAYKALSDELETIAFEIEHTKRNVLTAGFIERDEEKEEYSINGHRIETLEYIEFLTETDYEYDESYFLRKEDCSEDEMERLANESDESYFMRVMTNHDADYNMGKTLNVYYTEDGKHIMVIPDKTITGDKEITGLFGMLRG